MAWPSRASPKPRASPLLVRGGGDGRRAGGEDGARRRLAGEEIASVAGILNGTCNFILSEMERTERGFAEVLAEAQKLGYAEADPTTDVGGFDAGHKIAILAALAFGGAPNLAAMEIEGIANVELIDIRLARDLGYRIKLIASAERSGEGASVRVEPALVPLQHPLAQAGGALNALFIEGRRIGRIYMQGPGAGAANRRRRRSRCGSRRRHGRRRSRPVFQGPASGPGAAPCRRSATGQRDKAFLG